jgi:hypothetical protein
MRWVERLGNSIYLRWLVGVDNAHKTVRLVKVQSIEGFWKNLTNRLNIYSPVVPVFSIISNKHEARQVTNKSYDVNVSMCLLLSLSVVPQCGQAVADLPA